ncbi:MAG: xanthine dehydrogenase family protein subunit M [Deltaproteobacteria bacterium]
MRKFEYHAPELLNAALTLMDRYKSEASVLAGGTDLIVQMKSGQTRPHFVVDVKKIPESNRLEWDEDEGFHIGAAVPLNKLASFQFLKEKFGIFAQACSLIGSVQIRNRATMGGNICNAAPSADTAPPLLCLGAKAVVACLKGTRTISMEEFFIGPGQTALNPNELLVEVVIPPPPLPSAGCYLRHTPRAEMDIAVVGVGAFLVLSPQGDTIQNARIALGAMAPTPIRALQAEAVLTGKAPTQDLMEEAAEWSVEAVQPISDERGSAEYRIRLAKVLTRRTLVRACRDLGIEI